MSAAEALLGRVAGLPPAAMYAVIFLWLFVESTGFPISDEPLLLLAGSLAPLGRLDLIAIITVALVGKVVASCAAYWVGRRLDLTAWVRPAVRPARGIARWFHHLRPTVAALASAETFFRRRGAWGVFLGRLVPVVRSFISYPVGAAHMPFATFFAATTAGSLIWIATWTVLGAFFGRSYREAMARWGTASWLILAAGAALLLAIWVWHWRHQRRRTPLRESDQQARG